MPPQQTLARSATYEGRGLHTGEPSAITLHPAPENVGIAFLCDGAVIAARAEFVSGTDRGVSLAAGNRSVQTVEHLLAALHGMEIDNARIEVEGPEIPAADGSAVDFVRLIREAGIVQQAAQTKPLDIASPVWVEDRSRYVIALPASRFEVNYLVDFAAPVGRQSAGFRLTPSTFARRVASARTFVFASELKALLERGLAKGGTAENAIVVDEDGYSCDLRYPDEIARHKLLDLVGDLKLFGRPLEAQIIAVKAGHDLHVALVRKLVETAEEETT